MALSCAILDDEEHAIAILQHHIAACPDLELHVAGTEPEKILQEVMSGAVKLLFLDIQMPQMTGLEVAKYVPPTCKIIFTTAHTDHALDSYELGAIDYLLKPVSYPRFLKAVQKVLESRKAGSDDTILYLKSGNRNSVVKVDVARVALVEAQQNYVAFYEEGKKVFAYLTLKEAEERLTVHGFIRVSKSALVSQKHIEKVEDGTLYLQGYKEEIYISDSYREAFWARIRPYILSSKRAG